MKQHSRRDALKYALLGSVYAGAEMPVRAFGQAGTEATLAVTSPPKWARGADGQRRPDLGNGFYLNPIIPGNASDPDVVKDGSDYYMTFSTFDSYPGLPIYHSRDLVNWARIGWAISKPAGSILAPSITKHQGRFYIYFPGSVPGKGRGTVAVYADDIRGPWSDPVLVNTAGGIDPGHVVGEDGKRYLFTAGGNRVRLTDDGLKTDGPVEKVYSGWKYPDDWYDEAFGLESPKLFKRGDYFYLVSAEAGTYGPPTSHMIVAARSKSINGPWENCPNNPIIRTKSVGEPWWSRGHGVVIEGPNGDWWTIYHAYENGYRPLGRQAILEPLQWSSDGWFRATTADLSKPIRKPAGGQNIGTPKGLSDDFSATELGTQWFFPRATADEMSRVTLENGSLILAGKGTNFAECSPLTCIPLDRSYEASIEAEPMGQVETGIMLFIGSGLYTGIGHDGNRVKMYLKGAPGRLQVPTNGSGSKIAFRVLNDNHIVSFHFSVDGTTWTRFPQYIEASGYHQNVVRDGESLRIGLYAIGSGKVRFKNFTYKGNG
jgi:xylan 1,4-beta-xylosidase